MTEPITAWQCIGCGRIEAPQNCIGVCQDRRVEFVYAYEHAETEAELDAARAAQATALAERDRAVATLRSALAERDALDALVRRLAFSRPRDGEWERSYRALQTQARAALHVAECPQARAGKAAEEAARAPLSANSDDRHGAAA
jgi:hypothetical protein